MSTQSSLRLFSIYLGLPDTCHIFFFIIISKTCSEKTELLILTTTPFFASGSRRKFQKGREGQIGGVNPFKWRVIRLKATKKNKQVFGSEPYLPLTTKLYISHITAIHRAKFRFPSSQSLPSVIRKCITSRCVCFERPYGFLYRSSSNVSPFTSVVLSQERRKPQASRAQTRRSVFVGLRR